jgi:hypothetical protein
MTGFLITVNALLGLLILHQDMPVVDALPGGAAGCPSGIAAVNGPHVNNATVEIVTGPLAQGGVTLVVQDQDVVPPSNTINLMIGTEYTIGVRRDGGGSFRGVLLRAEDISTDPVGTLILEPREGDTLLHDATACTSEAPAVGITHTSRSNKTNVTGLIRYEVDADATAVDVSGATLDVTVVIQLAGGRSEFYHTSYLINFLTNFTTDPPNTPAPAPTKAPFAASPTKAPATILPVANDQCLYQDCVAATDCCPTAPICRSRTVGESTRQICSTRTRLQRTKLCGNCGGSGARPKRNS